MTERGTATSPAPLTAQVPLPRTIVSDVMTTAVVSVGPDSGFDEVAHLLRANRLRALPVLDFAGQVIGVVSEADLMGTAELGDPKREAPRGRGRHGDRPDTAIELMTNPVIAVVPTASVAEAARVMGEHKLGWLAVVETSESSIVSLVGVVGRSDLLTVFQRDDAELREEIVGNLLTRILLEDPTRVDVRVSEGVVTLAGQLPTQAEARLLVEFVERLEGVVRVIDHPTHDIDERVTRLH